METALKNLANTVELLAVAAHSDVLEQWDKQTLSRAFQWAEYCEHLYSRFHSNPSVRSLMEKQLHVTNQSLRGALPGYTELSFSDLSRCQHQLLVGLLNNTKITSSIMKTLFDSTCPTVSEHQNVIGLCSHIVRCRSACKVLSPLTGSSGVGADAEVQGMMLMERLAALMAQSSETCSTEHFVDSVLRGCEGAPQHFCVVIAAALLTTKNTAAKTSPQDALLDWLLKKQSILTLMCSTLSISLLTDLASEHQKFRDAYCDVLKGWASSMEYSISDGEWVQAEKTNSSVSFQKLTEHYLALFRTCPCLKDDVEKELSAFKISDGDFDISGLSIWGDLLSAINK